MISLSLIIVFIAIIWASIYTASFGVWTWRHDNKTGAIAVFVLAIVVLALPIYAIYFRY